MFTVAAAAPLWVGSLPLSLDVRVGLGAPVVPGGPGTGRVPLLVGFVGSGFPGVRPRRLLVGGISLRRWGRGVRGGLRALFHVCPLRYIARLAQYIL